MDDVWQPTVEHPHGYKCPHCGYEGPVPKMRTHGASCGKCWGLLKKPG